VTLTNFPFDPYLDMPPSRGQRVDRYRFQWRNGITDQILGYVQPSRETPPSLSHDTSGSIKRKLTLSLNVDDSARINTLTDRILPFQITGGMTYPLGRYMFTDDSETTSTGGDRGVFTLLDEGNIIDQPLETAYTSHSDCATAISELVSGLPIPGISIDATPFSATGAFTAGTSRGQAIDAYAQQGGLFSYWMGNDGLMHMIRVIDPAKAVPDFDWDAGFKVVRDGIVVTSDILTAPNKFVVISNASSASSAPIVGMYIVPPSAPHSIANRGFTIPKVVDMQVSDTGQATEAARSLGVKQTIFERTSITTSNDPRHDSYNIVHYQGVNWLELAWTMSLVPTGTMQHTIRKLYA
jgi:hypothetical protein